jgi:NAD(P)-dependent dehydrogenase (short-subunit alcohol dehydrogenase family)
MVGGPAPRRVASSDMLNGRRVLITGGSSGIGRGLVRAFADNGALVFAVARRADALAETIAPIEPGRVRTVAADITGDSGRRAVADSVQHAGAVLDVAIHAAGALGPIGEAGRLVDYPADEWHRVLDVNLSAVHFLHQRLAPFLDRGHGPAVIGVSSTVGRVGRAGWGMYSISKRALEGWLEVLAEEWDGRVYSVNPGGTRTPMRAVAMPDEDPTALPTPADIAPLFLRLAHPSAPEPSGSKLDARDWIGRDPWEGIADT